MTTYGLLFILAALDIHLKASAHFVRIVDA